MFFRVFVLLSLYATAAHGQDFACGFGLDEEDVSATSRHHADVDFYRGVDPSRTEPVHVLPLVGKLKDVKLKTDLNALYDRFGKKNQSITSLFDQSHEGSFPHFFNAMSYGKLSFEVPNRNTVAGKVFVSSTTKTTLADYGLSSSSDCGKWWTAVREFSEDVVIAADADPDIK